MLDAADRAIVRATQAGLPLTAMPYASVAEAVGMDESEVICRLQQMLKDGVIRRIAVVPNHYALGLTRNAMTVWDVDDEHVSRLGRAVGALEFVTHCYRRPRQLPLWRYNLFAMVHGRCDAEVSRKIAEITTLLGEHVRGRDVLVSKRVLKKTGMRISG